MPTAFQEVNQPARSDGTPNFQATQPVPSGAASAVSALGNLGVGVFQQVAKLKQRQDITEAETATKLALGGLQQKLLNIRDAGSTDSRVNVTQQSRLALTEFNVNYPELATEGTKSFKEMTGTAPAGLSVDEQAEKERRNKSLAEGFGRIGADPDYNELMHEKRMTLEAQDRILSSEIKQLDAAAQEGRVSKAKVKDKVLQSFQTLSTTYTDKTEAETSELISSWRSGQVTQEDALLDIRNKELEVTRMISNLGEFSTDPSVLAYTQPVLKQLALAKDVLLQKIDTEVAKANKDNILALAEAMFVSDPVVASAVAQSKLFDNAVGVNGIISKKATEFVLGGALRDELAVRKARHASTDTREHTDEDKRVVKAILSTATKTEAPEEQKLEAANAMSAVVTHLLRNGMDYDKDNINYVVDILNTPDAMSILNKDQKATVAEAFSIYVIDVVDVSVRENIVSPWIHTAPQRMPGERKPVSNVAELKVEGNRVYWSLKPKFIGNARAQKEVRELNRKISEDITPAISVVSEATGVSFSEVATSFLPGREEGEEGVVDDAKKTKGVTPAVTGDADTGKVDATPVEVTQDALISTLGERESSSNYSAVNQLGYLGKYQFGGLALQDLGYKNKEGEWTGKDGIRTEFDFLASDEVQEKSIKKHLVLQERFLKNKGAWKFIGKEFQGEVITKEGLLMASHLVGAGAVSKMLKTGEVPEDANNVKATEYLTLGNNLSKQEGSE